MHTTYLLYRTFAYDAALTIVPMNVVVVQLGLITVALLSGESGLNMVNIVLERKVRNW